MIYFQTLEISNRNNKTPLEVRTEALSAKQPFEYPIPEDKRINKYKEKWSA